MRFTVDHLLKLQGISQPLDLSPDGHYLALTVKPYGRGDAEAGGIIDFTPEWVPLDAAGSYVVIIDTETGESIDPFPEHSISWAPQWSPDGRFLTAYLQYDGPVSLVLWDLEKGDYQIFRNVQVHPYYRELPCWTPDSRHIVVKRLPADKPIYNRDDASRQDAKEQSVEVQSYDPQMKSIEAPEEGRHAHIRELPYWFDWDRGDLVRVDRISGEVVPLMMDCYFRYFLVSPDGKNVGVMRMKLGFANDLVIVSIDGERQQVIATQATQVFGDLFNWSPDSRIITYTSEFPDGRIRLFVVPADGSVPPTDITGTEISTLLHGNRGAPRWSASGHEVYILGWGKLWVVAADGSDQREIQIQLPDKETKDWIQPATSPLLWTTEEGLLPIVIGDYQTLKDGFAFVDLETGVS